MFKNATILTYSSPEPLDILAAEVAMGLQLFSPCGPSQDKSTGWAPPRGPEHGALIEAIGGHWIAKFVIETKTVPGPMVKRKLDERGAHIEVTEGRKPGRKESRYLREDIVQELLPHAFPKTASVLVWIDRDCGRIVLDTASQGKTDEVVTALVKALDGVHISMLNTQMSPQAVMTAWLSDAGTQPLSLAPGRYVELCSNDESKSLVKFDRHHLDDEQMRLHIGQGKLPTKLAMHWNDRVSFVLTEGMALRKIEFLDAVFDNAAEHDDVFDADVAIATGELGQLIDCLVKGLGGPLETTGATKNAAVSATSEVDPLLEQARTLVIESGKASISYTQRMLKIGYNRAASLMEALEVAGVVGPLEASGMRKVLAEATPA